MAQIHIKEMISQPDLDKLNIPQSSKENKEYLNSIGGINGLLDRLKTSNINGLTSDDVIKMRNIYGTNSFPESPMKGFFTLFFEAFMDTTIMILVAAAFISLVIGIINHGAHGWIEGGAILIAVFIVAFVSAGNDYTKELQFRALEASSQGDERCSVIRNGNVERINPTEIVVGDLLLLQAGDMIPADCIICDHNTMKSNESALTGEPEDLKKCQDGDCFLLSSCLLTEGEECRAIAIGIGIHSQWGKIKANLVSEAVNTPLQDKLEEMATKIGHIGIGFAIATFLVMILSIWARHGGEDVVQRVLEAFILAVTIVVVAIPEGLPLAVTIALAYSTKKMYQDQCFIRVLAACETMGNATNICSDKTGTLTENRMTVVEGYFADTRVDDSQFKNLTQLLPKAAQEVISQNIAINRIAYLIFNDSNGNKLHRPNVIGSKTEGALILMIRDWGIDAEVLKKEIYRDDRDRIFAFNSNKKRSTAVIKNPDGTHRLLCKGASEWVLKDCTHYLKADGKVAELTVSKITEIEKHILDMANNALRTLCLAHRDFVPGELPADWEENVPDNSRLILDCVVGIIDPLRSDVKEAVRIAQGAGVTVRMVTGDNIATACAIARQCGILTPDGKAIEGPVFRNLPPKEVDALLPDLQVMARSSPDDKYLLVTRLNGYGIPKDKEEWEAKHKTKVGVSWETHRDLLLPGYKEEWERTRPEGGQVVGVTGDGTNDAPALKAADVGLAMGITGTKVAQSASDIVILDDKFSSIVRAIMWGRTVYDNIRKFLQFQLTVNVVALTIVFIGACAGFDPPLNAVMMLWINLVMDTMGALALATAKPTMKVLDRKPYKRTASLISRPMMRNILVQSAFQLTLLLVLLFKGTEWFNINGADYCLKYDVDKSTTGNWNYGTISRDEDRDGEISCQTFKKYCPDKDEGCLEENHCDPLDPNKCVNFSKLHGFESSCLECVKYDLTHASIMFNAFVFCQLFNEYNAKSIHSDWNIFSTIPKNHIALAITFISIGFQIFLIEVGGDFIHCSPLTMEQWLITVALGSISIPLGILMRFIPVEEDPNCFFDNSKPVSLPVSV